MPRKKSRAAVELGVPLPRCEGPKLRPFEGRTKSIRFIRPLGDTSSIQRYRGSGPDGHVFEVDIDSKRYALKLFRFYDPDEHRQFFYSAPVPSRELVEAHCDPFYAECRALGRLDERKRTRKLAVGSEGYMGVPATYETMIEEKWGIKEWCRPTAEYDLKDADRQPFRAIVKELILEDIPLTRPRVRKMLTDLKAMRSVGVYPMDIHPRNYEALKLVDFSAALTEPHIIFQHKPPDEVQTLKNSDLARFEDMMEDLNPDCRIDVLPNHRYCAKLRRGPQMKRNRARVATQLGGFRAR